MQLNRTHQNVVPRQKPGSGAFGTQGSAKLSGDSKFEKTATLLDAYLPENNGTGDASTGGFNNPMDDADTLMRAILANYVEHKPVEKSTDTKIDPPTGVSAEDKALGKITEQFQSRFKENASDRDAFHSLMKKSFGESYDYSKAENIRQQTLAGDFSWMPEIKLVDAATLTDTSGQQGGGAGLGAYSKDNDTIYLSRELLASDPAKAEEILTEEVGHALDARINTSDAAGDEGNIFSILSHGGEISDAQLTELRSENDSGTIVVDGKEVEVEYGLFSKIKKGFKKIGGAIKKGVKKVAGAVKKGVKAVGSTIKKGFTTYWNTLKDGLKKVLNSKLFNTVLMVAQFIPIPAVQVVVRVANIAKAAYGVYQGVRHRSFAMVAGGVAGAFGGAARLGGALGSTANWVGTASKIANTAKYVGAAHQVISEKNLGAAASLASNYFGADSTAASVLNTAVKVDGVVKAVENDNLFGVVSSGTSLIQDFTGPEGDAFLSTINKHTNTIQQIDNARKTGNYSQALGLIRENFGDALNIPQSTQQTLQNIETGISYAQTVDNLIDNKDYANAAGLLLNTAASRVTHPGTQANIQQLGNTITTVDNAVTAYNDGRFNEAVGFAADALGQPLTDNTRNFVDTVQSRANTVENLVQAVKARDVETSTALLRDLTNGKHGEVINLIEKAGNTANTIDGLKTAIDNNDFSSAAGLVNSLFAGVTGKGLPPAQIATVQNLVTAVENKDVSTSAALLNDLTGGKHGSVLSFIQTADSAVNTAEDLKTAIENNDFSTALGLANSLSEQVSGNALPEQITTAQNLINAVESGNISGSSALLRELTQGKHSNIIDVFDSVGTAVGQVKDLQTAIEKKDYSTAAGLASDLSKQVIGRDNSLSGTLDTLSDVLAGKVQIRMDSLPGGIPGLTPGINSGVGNIGFNGPVIQPLMANGFGAGAGAVAGQTALAQALQPGMVEVPASSRLELSSVEQAALDRIEENLSQGWFSDVDQSELQDINLVLSELNPVQKNNVVSSLSIENLQTWGKEIDGLSGSLSDSEKADLYKGLASDLVASQLLRVYESFGEDHHSGLIDAVNEYAESDTRQELVNSILTQATSETEADNKSVTTQLLVATDALSKTQVAPPQAGLLSLGMANQIERGKQALEQMKVSPDADKKEIEKLEKQVSELTEIADNVAEKIGEDAIPFRAVLVIEENSATVPLQLYAEKTGDKSWKIIDATNTAKISTYEGNGDSSAEGLEAAWQDFVNDNDLPEGQIAGAPPAGISEGIDPNDAVWNQHSTGTSGFKAWSDGLGFGSMALAGAGVMSLFTGPGAAAAPALFGAAFGTGVASAGLNTYDRVQRDNFELLSSETALDALSLVGGPIGRGGKYVKFAAYSDVGAEVASGVILANEYAGQIREINENPGLSEADKSQQRADVYKQALLHGGVMVLGHGAGNVAARVSQAGNSVRVDSSMPESQVSVMHTGGTDGKRQIEVVHGEQASQAEIKIHSDVAKELAKNQGLYGLLYRNLVGEHSYQPNKRGEEVFFEVKKHEQLVSHYAAAVTSGQTDLVPRLEELQLDLAIYRRIESVVATNPDLANANATGQIDASPRFSDNKPRVTAAEARAAFEPKDGKFSSFADYKMAARADWKPEANTTYQFEGITVQTDARGRPKVVSGIVDPDRKVGRISGKDTELGKQPGAMADDVGFHLGADQLGFMGGPLNIVPGNRLLNGSDYKKLENKLAKLDKNHIISVEFEAVYNLGNTSGRPDSFEVRYSLDGGKASSEAFTNSGKRIEK